MVAHTPFGESCRWDKVEVEPAPPSAESASAQTGPAPGIDVGGGHRTCAADDTSPSGTVKNGYRKVQAMTAWGRSCRWEPVARSASTSEKN